VEILFQGANVFREGGRKIARGGGNSSSWGEEVFPPSSDVVTGETLFCDTGCKIESSPLSNNSCL